MRAKLVEPNINIDSIDKTYNTNIKVLIYLYCVKCCCIASLKLRLLLICTLLEKKQVGFRARKQIHTL
jgi:hypothetical protein